jgi:hypothetical protein
MRFALSETEWKIIHGTLDLPPSANGATPTSNPARAIRMSPIGVRLAAC